MTGLIEICVAVLCAVGIGYGVYLGAVVVDPQPPKEQPRALPPAPSEGESTEGPESEQGGAS